MYYYNNQAKVGVALRLDGDGVIGFTSYNRLGGAHVHGEGQLGQWSTKCLDWALIFVANREGWTLASRGFTLGGG